MSLEGENLRKNRLELMGFPGYGKNPGSPKDVRPRQHNQYPSVNDYGMDLEGEEFQRKYGSRSKNAQNESPASKETSRTIYALIAAGAIAISSLLANCVQWQKLSESEEMRQSQRDGLQDAFHRYDKLEEEYLKERTARRSAELTVRLQDADVIRMRQEYERVRELYRVKILEAQSSLPENGDSVSDNTNNGGRLRRGERSSVNDDFGNE